MKPKKSNAIKCCLLLAIAGFVLYTSVDVATTTTTSITTTTTSATGIQNVGSGAKANVRREFADENDNTDDYGESKRGYTHREEEEAVEEIRTSAFSSSSSSSKNKRRAKQKEILKTINGHAKMLPDKSPSRVYDIFTDDDDEFQDSNTASS